VSETVAEIGVFGLGVMGSALSLNLADNNFRVSVYNRNEGDETGTVELFLSKNQSYKNLSGFTELSDFVASLKRPRKIMIMVSASALDSVIDQLIPYLHTNDILIDAGNSHFKETNRRIENCKKHEIDFLGVGISGGEKGARFGPSIMPGGSKKVFQKVEQYLNAISAKDKFGNACMSYLGPEGAGHFVKMVHNGIEYVQMQLLAEVYQFLRYQCSNDQLSEIFQGWNQGELQSYLLEITAIIFQKTENNEFLIDQILDKAGNKGTGSWSTASALDLGSENSMMAASVFARYLSSQKSLRSDFAKKLAVNDSLFSFHVDQIKHAYQVAAYLNHAQGFELLRSASYEYNWNLNLSEIARIWTNGCIIRSQLMDKLVDRLSENDSLLDDFNFIAGIQNKENELSEIIQKAANARIAAPAFSSAWNYWLGLTTNKGPANLIQAQRDYFGAHTYQRIDDPDETSHHTNWEK